jgi:hypothetical protein
MLRGALIALFLSGCAASTLAGASTVTAAAVGTSALQRSAGGCYAMCTNGTACNARTGLCENLPCLGRCGPDEHCETTPTEDRCMPGSPSDVATRAPGTGTTLPVLPPPPPVSGGPPEIIPAAEKNPPK